MARRIVDSITYMTLATAEEEGRPWGSTVWYAPARPPSSSGLPTPTPRHSRNIASDPEIALAIFDSTVPIGGVEGVYMEAVAEQLGGAELERAIAIHSQSQEIGARRGPWRT